MSEIAKAYVQIVPSADGVSESIQKALGDGESVGKSFGSKISNGVGNALKVGAASVAAVSAAAVGAGKAIFDMASNTAQMGDAIDKSSQKIGISTDLYQELAYACERSGTSIEHLSKGAMNITNSLADAQNGVEGASKNFDALGVSLQKADGSFKSSEEVLKESLLALADMEDATQRNALANDIFGRSYQDMLPLLNSGSEGITQLLAEADEYGMVMSSEAVSASAAFQDSLTRLQGTFGGVKNAIVSDMLPGITDLMDAFSDLIAGNEGADEAISQAIDNILSSVTDAVPKLLEVIFGIADGILEAIPAIVEKLPMIIEGIVDFFANNADQIITIGVDIIVAVAKGLVKAIPTLVKAIPDIVKALVSGFKTLFNEFLGIGKNIVEGIWEGISGSLQWIKDKITGWVGNVIDFIKNLFGIHSPSTLMRDEIGLNLARGIGVGFENGIEDVNRAIEDSVQTEFDMTSKVGVAASYQLAGVGLDVPVNNYSSILEAIDNLGTAIQNMAIYLDSGALVGATAPAMNNALGQMAQRERRR